MTANIWDDTYATVIRNMLNGATNISEVGEEGNYRSLDIRFSYAINLGFPLLTARKVDFDKTKIDVSDMLISLGRENLDKICDGLYGKTTAIVNLRDTFEEYDLVFERVKNVLTVIVNVKDKNILEIPELTALFGLFGELIARSTSIKNLALQFNFTFCRMTEEQINALRELLEKETYELPTVAFKKQTSAYDYDPSYVTLRNYHYSE